jgi:hypothetical protein
LVIIKAFLKSSFFHHVISSKIVPGHVLTIAIRRASK